MTENTLPAIGVSLIHDRPTSTNNTKARSQQVIQLNLLESITKDILKSIRNNEQVQLRLGKKPCVQYGKKSISLDHGSSTFPTEIFSGPLNGKESMYFSGKLSHTLEVQKAKEATADSDEALAALQNTIKTMQEIKASNEAMVKTKDTSKKDPKPAALSGRDRFFGSTPASPFLAGRSPGLGPTSAPVLSASQTKEKLRLDAMRIPIVHLLAVGPMKTDDIAQKLNVSKDECEKVLDKVSLESNGKRELKEKSYRELDVWKFPYKTDEDREHAINHAIQAYDKKRLEKHDPLWQQLLPKAERGKGKVLSRLNIGKLVPPPKPVVSGDKDGKGEVSDREVKAKKPKTARDVLPKKKAIDEGKPKALKVATKTVMKAPKPESKFKSSERIENSDEEAEAAKAVVKAPLITTKAREKDPKRLPVPHSPSKPQAHKPRLSESSLSSIDNDRSAKPVKAEKPKPRPRTDGPHTNTTVRTRKDSSPQKRSPLASSPPTNSTDVEESSKASTQSSAPSSPPSSNDVPLAQQRRTYSPVVDPKTKQPLKRKVERGDDNERPAKKPQLNGDRLNSLPKSLTSQLQHPTPERRASDSSASSPEKSRSRQDVIKQARYFTSSYGKYRELHEKLSRLSSKEREDKDIERLWTMHKRLEEMKAGIWQDWAQVGGGE